MKKTSLWENELKRSKTKKALKPIKNLKLFHQASNIVTSKKKKKKKSLEEETSGVRNSIVKQ